MTTEIHFCVTFLCVCVVQLFVRIELCQRGTDKWMDGYERRYDKGLSGECRTLLCVYVRTCMHLQSPLT